MNALAQEASVFLRTHADDPVDWHAWQADALRLAREQDRPILLSIGYSTCHGCHVMARESFRDPHCAALINRHFVAVLVDREEHPELDQLYQQAHLLLTRKAGGWPLTLFLSPDGIPFYGGTYYPACARHELPAFNTVLEKVARAWHGQRSAIEQQNPQLLARLRQTLAPEFAPAGDPLDDRGARACLRHLLELFDPRDGGFGRGAKFPHPLALEFLLHRGVRHDDAAARHAALHSLRKMAAGALQDHLGGGFFRYCSDPHWSQPHFEKLLADNALLLWLYSEAFALTGEDDFRRTAQACADWLLREMRLPDGAFCSALDYDSPGSEPGAEQPGGQYYRWSREEIRSLLDGERLALVSAHYGLDAAPEAAPAGCLPRIHRPLEEVAASLAIPPHTARLHLDAARASLLAWRDPRPRPARDDKLLCAANAFAIRALARGADACQQPAWLEAARRALAAVRQHNLREGRLLVCSYASQDGPPGLLDDYAALLGACLELLQADFRPEDLALARQLAEALLTHFERGGSGGFNRSAHDAPATIVVARPIHDEATPAGNPLAARALLRLAHLIGEPRYLAAAESCLRAFHAGLGAHAGLAGLAMLVDEWLSPPLIVVLRGDALEARAWRARLRSECHPDLLCLYVPAGLESLPATLDKPAGSATTAWIQRGARSLPPAGNLRELLQAIAPEPDYLPENWQPLPP